MKQSSHALLLAALIACGDNTSPDTHGPDAGTDPDVDAPLPPPIGITFFDFPLAIDVSPDGRIAVFESITTEQSMVVFHDTVTGERWTTVGVSPNIIDASFEALLDAINYKLLKDGAKAG